MTRQGHRDNAVARLRNEAAEHFCNWLNFIAGAYPNSRSGSAVNQHLYLSPFASSLAIQDIRSGEISENAYFGSETSGDGHVSRL